MKVIIMTQKTCPQCDALKMTLHAAFRGKYDDRITTVMKEERPEEFEILKEEVDTSSTPTVIFVDGEEIVHVIRGYDAPDVMQSFNKYMNK